MNSQEKDEFTEEELEFIQDIFYHADTDDFSLRDVRINNSIWRKLEKKVGEYKCP